jgi:hexosaminidase
MTKKIFGIAILAAMMAPALLALESPSLGPIKLEPSPKELQLRDGSFKVGPRTKIFVLLGHQSEDRIAAETLAEEVEDQSGLKLDILGMNPGGKAEDGAIVLARLQDERVRRFLARNGLKADDAVGADGYLLFSDNSHLIVAANSGQGIFYGVQTLRQLLRPLGKGLICPALGIRDWPSLQQAGLPPDGSSQDGLFQGGHEERSELAHEAPPAVK